MAIYKYTKDAKYLFKPQHSKTFVYILSCFGTVLALSFAMISL
jgi:hypothetical protein